MDKTASGILKRMMTNIPAKYNRDTGGYIHDILSAVSFEFENEYKNVDLYIRKLIISTSEGLYLDELLSQYGFTRREATFASGHVVLKGDDGAVVQAGSLVSKGKTVYVINETVILNNGSASAQITAQQPGVDGNAEINCVNYFPTTLAGVISVTNPVAITGGTDEETDDAFKERFYRFLENPAASGNKYEYEKWALEGGAGSAKCFPLWNGPGTVKIAITKPGNMPADGDDVFINKIYKYIEDKRPVGANVTVAPAECVAINVSAAIIFDSKINNESVIQKSFVELLSNYFNSIDIQGGTISYTKIGSLLYKIEGIKDYSDLLVNDAEENIVIDEGTIAIAGGVALEFTE